MKNALEGVHAQGILEDAAALWKAKRKDHTVICTALFSVFVALVAGAIWTGGVYVEDILLFIKASNGAAPPSPAKPGDTLGQFSLVAVTLSRVLLISLPVGMILWILRAVLRVALLNLSLREDAAQRSVMIQTYVNLVSAGSAQDETDRGLILSAIFRPLPDEHNAEVAPPNLADLMKSKASK